MLPFKGTLTRNILAFLSSSIWVGICWVYADVFTILLLPGYFNIWILNFDPHQANRFIIHKYFTEHALNNSRFPEHTVCVFSEYTWKCYCPHACSGNTFKIAQACSENTSSMFRRVQRTGLSDFQVCSVKHVQIMKYFARWG
jgi:hypothetical protein